MEQQEETQEIQIIHMVHKIVYHIMVMKENIQYHLMETEEQHQVIKQVHMLFIDGDNMQMQQDGHLQVDKQM